jgi:hypothetical protein
MKMMNRLMTMMRADDDHLLWMMMMVLTRLDVIDDCFVVYDVQMVTLPLQPFQRLNHVMNDYVMMYDQLLMSLLTRRHTLALH